MNLFADNPGAAYKIHNMREERSGENSLFLNVLEAVGLHGRLDDALFTACRRMGHRKKNVEYAIRRMCDRPMRLLAPKSIVPDNWTSDLHPAYTLTKKGHYYLQIVRWPEYISRFGKPGDSLEGRV
jgi:hypothetical protein